MKTAIALPTLTRANRNQSGSTIVFALGVLVITSVIVGLSLREALGRFRTVHHSSKWAQAGQAAEAGAEIALLCLQENPVSALWIADGWTGAPGAPGTAAVTRTVTLNDASGPISADIKVDKITLGGATWARIRSRGHAGLFGGRVASNDSRDSLLRKLSLRFDREGGANLGTPRVTRTVEILAEPRAFRPFRFTFFSRALFDIHTNTTSDSYDSSVPSKSNFAPFGTYGIYDAAKKQTNGDVGTLDPLIDWNFNSAQILGDVLMPTTTKNAVGTSNVSGSVTKGFTFTFPNEVAPVWAAVTTNHGAVTNVSKTFSGGTKANPTRHKFTSLNLTSDTKNIRVTNPVGQTESWVEIWVVGDTLIDAKNQTGIKIDPGVHATIHFGGNVDIKGGSGGYALSNDSKRPENLIVRGYGGSSGATKQFTLAYTDFWGAVSAPWYKVKFDMNNKHVHGSFLTWQFDCTDGTRLHYDEALANFNLDGAPGYEVGSWVEGVR